MYKYKEQKPKFIVDAMLGKLAKKLRLLGYDTFYSSSIADNKIIIMAKNEKRILLTKDRILACLAPKNEIKTVATSDGNELDQFRQIKENVGLNAFAIEGKISRCTNCNSELLRAKNEKIIGKVPDGVIRNFKEFWECKKCKKIYWNGTHIKNLQTFVSELNEKL